MRSCSSARQHVSALILPCSVIMMPIDGNGRCPNCQGPISDIDHQVISPMLLPSAKKMLAWL